MKITFKILFLTLLCTLFFTNSEVEATIHLPRDLEIIEAYAFYGGASFEKVVIPDSVIEIHSKAFARCGFSEIYLPESLIFIADDAFDECDDLIIFAEKSSYAYEWALEHGFVSTSTKNDPAPKEDFIYTVNSDNTVTINGYVGNGGDVVMPSTIDDYIITEIASNAFFFCESLTSITLPNNLITISEQAFGRCENLTNIIFPDTLITIGDYSFFGCSLLSNVTLPSRLNSLGKQAFFGCISLESIAIPDSVSSLDIGVFSGCNNLQKILLSGQNPNFKLIDGMLLDSTGQKLHTFLPSDYFGSIVIPSGVQAIDDMAFYGCKNLTHISIPNSVTVIGNQAFYLCTGLTSIEFPDSIISVGDYAFAWCDNLENIAISDGVVSIGDHAFSGTGITSITIPESVTTIGDYVFLNCNRSLVIYGVSGSYIETYAAEYEIPFRATDNIDDSSHEAVLAPEEDFEYIVNPDNSATVTSYVGEGGAIVMPESLNGHIITEIGDYAFIGCENLTAITIPDRITTIGCSAFYACYRLESINIPDSVIAIGDHAFYFCTELASISISENLVFIGSEAFAWCESLTYIAIPSSVTDVGEEAFSDCSKLLVIKGISGSYIESYANVWGINFLAL